MYPEITENVRKFLVGSPVLMFSRANQYKTVPAEIVALIYLMVLLGWPKHPFQNGGKNAIQKSFNN